MEVDSRTNMEVDPQIKVNEQCFQGILSEVTTMYQPYIEKLCSSDEVVLLEGLKQIKNFVIGNNKQKTNFIVLGAVPRLVYLIQQEDVDVALKVHCAVILGSLAKGVEANMQTLLDCGVLEVMHYGLRQRDLKMYEACLCCIRTIVTFQSNYGLMFLDVTLIPIMLESINKSMCTQECTCEIIAHCCRTSYYQSLLYDLHAIDCLTSLLVSNISRVKIKALRAISVMCYKNAVVCKSVAKAQCCSRPVVEILIEMLSGGHPSGIQINAAKCLTYIYRSVPGEEVVSKAVCKKILSRLISVCESERDIDERVVGAKTVAYLIEAEPELQNVALICMQFPLKLSAYFRHPTVTDTKNVADMRKFKHEMGHEDDLLESVFLAYASLMSNDEDIRYLVATDLIVQHLVKAMDNQNADVRISALQCLLSLSRSVRILRTLFEDFEVWKGVLKILEREFNGSLRSLSEREKVAASALVCNLLLEFSPCKTKLLSSNLMKTLKCWCEQNSCVDLKRNAIWSLFNLTFQAELNLKSEVMTLLTPDLLFLLVTSCDYDVVTKTLGVLSNVLVNSEHCDRIMSLHGDAIMQACAIVIESTSLPSPPLWCSLSARGVHSNIYTYCLSVLQCVTAGNCTETVRKYLLENDNFLRKFVFFMGQHDDELQSAAVECVHTLCRSNNCDSYVRKVKMTELGAMDALQRLMATSSGPLYERAKSTLALLQLSPDL